MTAHYLDRAGTRHLPDTTDAINVGFSRRLPKGEHINASQRSKEERGLWQRRHWEHTIRDEEDFHRPVDYVHYNPVKHGYVTRLATWPYSSIHRYIRDDIIPPDWSAAIEFIDGGEFGKFR